MLDFTEDTYMDGMIVETERVLEFANNEYDRYFAQSPPIYTSSLP